MPNDNTIELIGIEGLSNPNVLEIAKQQTIEALKRLPEGDQIALLKSLPEDIIRAICTEGVDAELGRYWPAVIAFLISAFVSYGYFTQDFINCIMVAAFVGAGTYFVQNTWFAPPSETKTLSGYHHRRLGFR